MDKTERELREMLADRRLVRWPTEPQWNDIWKTANAKGYAGTVSMAVHSVAPDLLDPDWAGMMASEHRDTMWSEIRLRRSVAPFRKNRAPVAFNPDASEEAAGEMQQQIAKLISQRWADGRATPRAEKDEEARPPLHHPRIADAVFLGPWADPDRARAAGLFHVHRK